MNYEEFKEHLQNGIMEHLGASQVHFEEHIVNKSNEILEGLTIRIGDSPIAPTFYPSKLYEDYLEGERLENITKGVSASLVRAMREQPDIPDLTPENAKKYVSFSLLNKEKNQRLLAECPHKVIHDMVAIPRWHINEEASFVVNNNVMYELRMTKEEIFDAAQKNTESAAYSCRSITDVMKDMMKVDGIPEEVFDEMFPVDQPQFYVLTNPGAVDGSCAMLSDSFMQKVVETVGSDEFYIIPSSRHEVLAINPNIIDNPENLKSMVMEVNRTEVSNADFLSDNVYKYNAHTHSIMMGNDKGHLKDKETATISKTGKLFESMGRK